MIVQAPMNVLQLQKPSITFTCIAIGNPLPKITWNFTNTDGVYIVLESTSNTIYNDRTVAELNITNITKDDFGKYSCDAVNKVGINSSVAILQSGKFECC